MLNFLLLPLRHRVSVVTSVVFSVTHAELDFQRSALICGLQQLVCWDSFGRFAEFFVRVQLANSAVVDSFYHSD